MPLDHTRINDQAVHEVVEALRRDPSVRVAVVLRTATEVAATFEAIRGALGELVVSVRGHALWVTGGRREAGPSASAWFAGSPSHAIEGLWFHRVWVAHAVWRQCTSRWWMAEVRGRLRHGGKVMYLDPLAAEDALT